MFAFYKKYITFATELKYNIKPLSILIYYEFKNMFCKKQLYCIGKCPILHFFACACNFFYSRHKSGSSATRSKIKRTSN